MFSLSFSTLSNYNSKKIFFGGSRCPSKVKLDWISHKSVCSLDQILCSSYCLIWHQRNQPSLNVL